MSLLHDYFNAHNLQLFQRLLDSSVQDKSQPAAPSTSGGKSWKKHGLLNVGNLDVNCKDWLGRTVLHLTCSSTEHLDYVRALLKHPAINVNLRDTESHWTPLHHALYCANIPAARLLLQRPDNDPTLKDHEGYTAFDVYNSTVIGTKPAPDETEVYADLYTWGTNVNAALGLGDSNDRVYPEHVILQPKDDVECLEQRNLSARFAPVRVKRVDMSKLHTAVVTSEGGGNLRVCGFGSGGRLGSNSYTQYTLKPLPQLNQSITSVALGQDHTLALTKNGEVFSWGLNRFSQLGYPVDPPTSGRSEEPIQYTPRKVQGFLRKEIVKGIAASKCASACWTEESVYTWGTNNGQLGYDKAAQPVQVLPRKVSRLTMSVISISMTEVAMACLMQNGQVECFYNNGHHRINFPMQAFPSPIRPYRPPQAVKDSGMTKITSCGDIFASLSYHGEVYIFSPNNNTLSSTAYNTTTSSSTQDTDGTTRMGGPFKCQRVWALRKKSSAVKDVALGIDGSIVICTESGHVFVRTRNAKLASGSLSNFFASSGAASQKAFKFQRVPFLQRVIRVCANSSGAFGALRVEVPFKSVDVKGELVGQELSRVAPWLAVGREDEREDVFGWKQLGGMIDHDTTQGKSRPRSHVHVPGADSDNEELEGEEEEDAIENDIRALKEICDVVKREKRSRKAGINVEYMALYHGADMVVVLQSGATFPVHKVVLAARSEALGRILSAQPRRPEASVRDEEGNIVVNFLSSVTRGPRSEHHVGPGTKSLGKLSILNANPLAVLIVLNYLYSDNVITVWDPRVLIPVAQYAQKLKIKWDVTQIKNELMGLARALQLVDILSALQRPVKVMLPARSAYAGIVKDLIKLFDTVNSLSFKDKEGEKGDEGVDRELVNSAKEEGTVEPPKQLKHDVILELKDREVYTHSVILRARSDLFKSFFDEPDWTRLRWDGDLIKVNLRHLDWRVMKFVLRFMCCGCDKELFETLEFVKDVDDLVEFMFGVMAAANELLLDRLVLLCSDIILTYSDFHNACYVLAEATYYSAAQLIDRIQSYIITNLDLFLELRILDDMPHELLVQLTRYAQEKQREKAPYVRGGQLIERTLEKWRDWVEEQDIPGPFVRSNKPWHFKQNAVPIPKFEKCVKETSTKVLRKPPSADDIFIMDTPESPAPAESGAAWKVFVAPKVDMKTVMAEAALDSDKLGQSSRSLLKPQRTPILPAASPQIGEKSPRTPGSSWKASMTPQQRPEEETTDAQPSGPPVSQPSTPQKQKDGLKPPVSPRRTPSAGQLPNTTTPTKCAPAPVAPGSVMGPTITPTRMQANLKSSLGQRSISGSNPAWMYTRPMDTIIPIMPAAQNVYRSSGNATASSSFPPSSATDNSFKSKSISFLAIQHSQEEEQLGDSKKDKRSFVEIQEEEKARREEETFLRWWEEEEARVKMEMEALEKFKQGSSSSGGGNKQKKSGRGRGGGGGGGGSGGEKKQGKTADPSERAEKSGDASRGGRRGGHRGRKEGKCLQSYDGLNPGGVGSTQPTNMGTSPIPTQDNPPPQYRKSNQNSSGRQPQGHPA